MKEMASMALRLGIIGAAAALLLAMVNSFTEPKITSRRAEELQQTLLELAGGAEVGATEEQPAAGVLKRWPIDGGGWILELPANGYGGPMTLVCSYKADGSVLTARLMDNDETVGFGKKAEDAAYMEIFAGKGGDAAMPKSKADLESGADMVSGATITFTAIAGSLKIGSDLVKKWGNQ